MARKCTACGIRAIGSGAGDDAEYARNMGYCNPCCTRFDHDNDHDNDHNRAPEECWVCTPAIDLSAAPAVKGHTNTVAKTRTSHAACDHDVTPAARAACRKARLVASLPVSDYQCSGCHRVVEPTGEYSECCTEPIVHVTVK